MSHPPADDTFLGDLQAKMRAANPNVVINVRDGIWSDYFSTTDEGASPISAPFLFLYYCLE